jgi:hypothetical protein
MEEVPMSSSTKAGGQDRFVSANPGRDVLPPRALSFRTSAGLNSHEE